MHRAVISLLRAVNVGGKNAVSMEALRALYEELGYTRVTSYLQSGNVVFDCAGEDRCEAGKRLEEAIAARFGAKIPVLVRTRAELEAVIRRNPFAGRAGIDGSRLAVVFLSAAPERLRGEQLQAPAGSPEEFWLDGQEIFVYYPDGLGRSKLNSNFFESRLKVLNTTRNWNTVEKLYRLAIEVEKGK